MQPRIENPKLKKLPKWKFFFMKRYLPFHIFWITTINRNKLKQFMLTRKEAEHPDCLSCGLCCIGCLAYDKENGWCRIWKDADFRCRQYPLSPLQLKVYGIQDFCRYYWEEK